MAAELHSCYHLMLFCNHMVRTQIQLTEAQVSALQAMAASRRMSMAKLIRSAVDSLVQREGRVCREAAVARAKSLAGRFSSGSKDLSRNHDRYLAEAYGERGE